MATADAHQPDRQRIHRRICLPVTGHAHHAPGAPPNVTPPITGAICRSNGPSPPLHDHVLDACLVPIRIPPKTSMRMTGMLRCHICPNVLAMSGAVKRA